MGWLPGWDSVESTGTIAHSLHITAVIVLGLLFIAEGMALIYDFRKEKLTTIAERAAAQQRHRDANAAEARRKSEVEGLQQQLSGADKRLAEIDRLRQPRRFTDEQKTKLIDFITTNSSGSASFTIKASMQADDARAYADAIAAVFNNPPIGWKVKVDNAMIVGPDTTGIWMTIRNRIAIPHAAGLLHHALLAAGIPVRNAVEEDPNGPAADEIWLSIGSKR